MRVHVVDPSAYTPPYDHALCHALGVAGVEVELATSRFAYAAPPPPVGYARRELFYRHAFGAPGSRPRAASKLVEHVPDMLRYRRHAREADLVHFQWLPVQALDVHLLPGGRPLVLTSHDVLPREPRRGQLAAQRRLYDRFDAIVVHSERGRSRLVDELRVDGDRVHVIAHGAFTHLLTATAGAKDERGVEAAFAKARPPSSRTPSSLTPSSLTPSSLTPSSRTPSSRTPSSPAPSSSTPSPPPPTRGRESPLLESNKPVVLMFGLMRPYKGIDVLLEAWRGVAGASPIEHAELWVAGLPKMDISRLRGGAPANVRFDPRFIPDEELPAYFEAADLVVLPYLQADQSGVLFTALAFGKPLLLSDVGGFPEMADTGAARIVPAGDAVALGSALRMLLRDSAALEEMSAKARAAARGRFSWEASAAAHIDLYTQLLG